MVNAEMRRVVTVVLADEFPLVRHALSLLLHTLGGEDHELLVVRQVGTQREARAALTSLQPDMMITELELQGRPTLAELPAMLNCSPQTKIVVLTSEDDPESAQCAMRAGASGYVLKRVEVDALRAALSAVMLGGTYLDSSLGAAIVLAPAAGDGGLSAREREVLRLIAMGYTNAQIGRRLYVSLRTVEAHRATIRAKLGITTRAELSEFAFSSGLARLPRRPLHMWRMNGLPGPATH